MQTKSDIPGTDDAARAPRAVELECLSALVDGEAAPREVGRLIQACAQQPALQNDWAVYLQIGEVLREGERASAQASGQFAAGVMARLHAETSVSAWEASRLEPLSDSRNAAANDAVFRWKLVAGLASVAAVATVVWQVVATPAAGPAALWAQNSVQQAPVQQAQWTPQGVLIRDPQLESMLAAHRQYGGQSALQMPAGFLRNATYEVSER